MTAEIKPLFGGFTHQPEVVESLVAMLEGMLQAAKDGQLIGMVAATVNCKGNGSYQMAGRVGGYTVLGGLEMVKAELIGFNFECEED
jgi:hypothetical protein